MRFLVETKPQGKARARTFYDNRAGKMRSVTPEQTRDYESLVRWSYKAAGGEYYDKQLISVDIQAFYPIPKSFSKKKHTAAVMGKMRPTSKPDLDNIVKAILDSLNGVAWYDDSQVVSLTVNKYYGERGYVAVTVEPSDI